MIKIFLLAGLSFFNAPKDSIGFEKINGKILVLHRVGEKETLYGISKYYNVTVSQILEYNPTADAGLDIGQILKIPYVPRSKPVAGTKVHTVAEKETLYSISKMYAVSVEDIKRWNNLSDNALDPGQQLVINAASVAQLSGPSGATGAIKIQSTQTVHTVAPKETLFSISRQYALTVQQLKEWNGLTSEELSVGQSLFVSQPMYSSQTTEITPEVKPPVNEEKILEQVPSEVITITESVKDKSEVKESGLAELIEGTEGNRKYLALHRTAPVGTILKVRNEMNNREVFVRIIGALPETAMTDRLIIRISKSAYDRLGAIDPRFRVEVTYYK